MAAPFGAEVTVLHGFGCTQAGGSGSRAAPTAMRIPTSRRLRPTARIAMGAAGDDVARLLARQGFRVVAVLALVGLPRHL